MANLIINDDSSILITGGTGSFGQELVKKILSKHPNIRRLVIFSRDELKQYEMEKVFSTSIYPGIRYFIGDVRDKYRVESAFDGIDIVVHAAALKQVPIAEYNPFEFIKTNILGAQNVIEASISKGVKKVVALSTDKAAAPINLYGATKLCSDKLFIAANNIVGKRKLAFSVVRYGNVMGSRGSVIPLFINQRDSGTLTLTSENMTRFNLSLRQGVEIVLWTVENSLGGEIIVPKIPSYKIMDLVEAIAPKAKVKIVGIRPGEKLHEDMITASDSVNTIDIGAYYAILPNANEESQNKYLHHFGGKLVLPGFIYNSGTNSNFLSVEELRNILKNELN
jgi:UDP-N-acetylglucosamine 4,6-dehydratase (inverting)